MIPVNIFFNIEIGVNVQIKERRIYKFLKYYSSNTTNLRYNLTQPVNLEVTF